MTDPQLPEQHYVYVARCANGSLYTGYSKNVERRIAMHNAGKGARYTRAYRPILLVACWSFKTKTEALQSEYAFKQLSRQKKLAFIEGCDRPYSTDPIFLEKTAPPVSGFGADGLINH
jgi:putative endonuclease